MRALRKPGTRAGLRVLAVLGAVALTGCAGAG